MNPESQFVGVILAILIVILAIYGLFYQIATDFGSTGQTKLKEGILLIDSDSLSPLSPIIFPKTQVLGVLSSYNPVPEQTDSTPDYTASGEKVREGIVANNCLPFGTKVEIDGRIYEVQDRMNSRYGCEYFDILSFDEEWSLNFGRQKKEVTIY